MASNGVRWGILGCAGIARKVLIPAIRATTDATLHAIASRDAAKAAAWAKEFGAAHAYASYEALLADPAIDAVYIPLPNAQHAPWTLRALAAGKHVLCEKPLAATAAEAQKVANAARETGKLVLEAFMYRFHPLTRKIVELVRDDAVGPVLTMRGAFSFVLDDAANVRLLPAEAGGALMDVGCYCVSFARLITGEEPRSAFAAMRFAAPQVGDLRPVDLATTGTLTFPSGATLQFSSRFDSAADGQWFEIVGTRGKLRVERPFNQWRPGQADPTSPLLLNGERIEVENRNHFELQVAAFDHAILHGDRSGLTSIEDGVGNMRAIDALYASALEGRVVEP